MVLNRLTWLCASLILATVTIALLGRYVMPKLSIFSRFVLAGEQDVEAGYISGTKPEDMPKLGDSGETVSELNPAGKILIKNQFYDVMSSGSFIKKGESVIVVRIDGNHVFVEHKES